MVALHRLGAHLFAVAFRSLCGAGTHSRYPAKPVSISYYVVVSII